jgi:hypothetical protein
MSALGRQDLPPLPLLYLSTRTVPDTNGSDEVVSADDICGMNE